MRAFEAATDIGAGVEQAWAVLVDVAGWPSWDSGVDGVDGATGGVAVGTKLTIRAAVAKGRAFPVRVTTLEAPSRMVFTGGMPLGLFRGVRTYTLTPTAGGARFVMREEYSGPLAGLIGRSIPDLGPSFEQFARGLKARVETG